MHSPSEVAKSYVDIGINKTRLSAFRMLLLGFFAGMFIAFAGVASTAASTTISTGSLSKIIGAIVFPAGMAMVIIAGSELFTGNSLIIISVLEKKVSVSKMLKNWLFVYIGNFLGAMLVALFVTYSHVPDLFDANLAQAIVNAGAARTNLTFSDSFVRGILCNILVCIAVWSAAASKQVSGKLIVSFWPVMVFVLCGFEHCIADMYFCLCALFTSFEYGIHAGSLSWSTLFTHNLIPVTLGNLVGGVAVGFGYWLAYLWRSPKEKAADKQAEQQVEPQAE